VQQRKVWNEMKEKQGEEISFQISKKKKKTLCITPCGHEFYLPLKESDVCIENS